MAKMNLESTLLKALEEVALPGPFHIKINPKGGSSRISERDFYGAIFVQLSVRSKKETPERDADCSYLDFIYDSAQDRLETTNLSVIRRQRGRGYGRKLVEAMEKTGRELGCRTVIIRVNINHFFWTHMGYEPNEEYWEKTL